jgi:NADPH2:quinone reductase
MKAVVAYDYGAPETVVLEERPLPQPGPGEVRVAIHRVGVSFVDVLLTAGRYQVKPPLPYTPGTECSGVVDAVGEGVTHLRTGDRVIAGGMGGALAQYNVYPAASIRPIPDAMPFDEAAVFRVSYTTAYYALVQRGRLAKGETVLVLGAAGAVGVASIQVAKALGARVIASASTEAKRALTRTCGADDAVDSTAADWRDQIKALTDGKGVDVVVDPVGGSATEPAFRSLGWRGRHLVIGFAQGEIPKLPTNLPLLKGAALVGVDIRQFGINEPATYEANVQALFALHRDGLLKPAIAARFPLEAYAEALSMAAAGVTAGRVVVEVA